MSTTTFYTTSSLSTELGATPNLNYLKPNAFKFQIAKLPNVTYTLQSANLPAIQLGSATQETPFVDIPHPGDKVAFGDFQCTFLISEDLSNYKELYDWIFSIGIPTTGDQWGQISNRANVYREGQSWQASYSDAMLIMLNSNNNPTLRIHFEDVFPVSLEGLQFDITSAGMEYFVGQATFRYKAFTLETT